MLSYLFFALMVSFTHGWKNYQGEWPCKSKLKKDAYPKTLDELQSIVQKNKYVKAVGSGHSWDPYIGCAGTNGNAVNVVMTDFEVEKKYIEVDLDEMVVKVPASMLTRDVLRYLDGQKSDRFPKGLSLRSYPWWIDQTLCGAVATGTHGSSMHPDGGSLSNQVKCLGMVLADGQYQKFCEDTHPEEMRALKVSAGRLGVIAHCYMKIIPSENVKVTRQFMTPSKLIGDVQSMGKVFKSGGEEELEKKFDNTQYLWFVPTDSVYRWKYDLQGSRSSTGDLMPGIDTYNFSNPEAVKLPGYGGKNMRNRPGDSMAGLERAPVSLVDLLDLAEVAMSKKESASGGGGNALVQYQSAEWWSNQIEDLMLGWYPEGTFAYKDAFLQNPTSGSEYTLYDQYEFSLPISEAATCLKQMNSYIQANGLDEGFRSPILVRLVKAEKEILLSNSVEEPHLYMNINDDLSYNLPGSQENISLLKIGNFLREKCNARLHWGKTKATLQRSSDLNGAKDYPKTWCKFGEIAKQMDPLEKFAGAAGKGSAHYYWDWSKC